MNLTRNASRILNFHRKFSTSKLLCSVKVPKVEGNLRCVPTYMFDVSRAVYNKDLSLKNLEESIDFKSACDIVIRNMDSFTIDEKISMLQSLLTMGIDPNNEVVEFLEQILLERCKTSLMSRQLTAFDTLRILKFHVPFQETTLQKDVIKTLVNTLKAQLDQMNKDIHQLYACWKMCSYNVFDVSFMTELESQTVKYLIESKKGVSSKVDVDILLHLPVLLASVQRRNLTLLHLISSELTAIPSLDVTESVHIINCLYALNSLNYLDFALLSSLTSALGRKGFPKHVKPAAVAGLLTAIGQLNLKDEGLLQAVADEIAGNISHLRWQERLHFVLTSAKLNYHPTSLSELLRRYVFPHVTKDVVDNKWLWLDYVWSLTVLNCLDVTHAESVLNEEYYAAVSELDVAKQDFWKMKFLNIKASAELYLDLKCELPNTMKQFSPPKKTKEMSTLHEKVILDVANFIPLGKFLSANVPSSVGTVINGVFIANHEMKLLPLEDFKDKSLPEGYKRVCLMVYGFRDYILNSEQLIGIHNLTQSLLEKQGFSLVSVNQQNYPYSMKEIQRTMVLRDLIKKSITNESNLL